MCGIIGYTGPRPAAPILLDSLRRLEYRGYDSAGIAIIDADGDVATVKNTNKVADLARQVEAEGTPSGTVGIGHTRWATHGSRMRIRTRTAPGAFTSSTTASSRTIGSCARS